MSEEKRSGLLLGVDPVAGYTSIGSHGGARMDDDGGGDGDSGDGSDS